MGRAEKRRTERARRINNRKGKLLMSHQELRERDDSMRRDISSYDVEALMTCFALAERRLYKFGQKRLTRTLGYINELMDDIIEDKATIEDYKKIIEEETGVVIRCK